MPAFVIALLLMPVIAYGIKNFTILENKGITVGIMLQEKLERPFVKICWGRTMLLNLKNMTA